MNSPEDTMLMERDLDALDAALSAGHADHEDQGARELQELALLLRDEAARPRRGFRACDARADGGGIPPEGGLPGERGSVYLASSSGREPSRPWPPRSR